MTSLVRDALLIVSFLISVITVAGPINVLQRAINAVTETTNHKSKTLRTIYMMPVSKGVPFFSLDPLHDEIQRHLYAADVKMQRKYQFRNNALWRNLGMKCLILKCYYDQFGNLFLITYFENVCKSGLPCQVWSPNMIWKCVYLHGNFRKCLAAITRFKK